MWFIAQCIRLFGSSPLSPLAASQIECGCVNWHLLALLVRAFFSVRAPVEEIRPRKQDSFDLLTGIYWPLLVLAFFPESSGSLAFQMRTSSLVNFHHARKFFGSLS